MMLDGKMAHKCSADTEADENSGVGVGPLSS